ncbi:hypothetical protein BDY19DRAFT_995260 [Irpex rosettiformis]|uniref:Uncharacterized protein n=1 Tax=Irpex rosettiformis TaxID=378272 RepID=A0ACB8TYU9_9APHY|nr:hypothetical protein BDY19DRAFT_995260 [Irpex rosettiformis]
MSNSSRSSTSSVVPNTLVALPSLSSSLSSLPQARSLDGIAIHPTSMSAQRHAESEAKLRKALSKSATSSHSLPVFVPNTPPSPYSPDSPALTMRKPLKHKATA